MLRPCARRSLLRARLRQTLAEMEAQLPTRTVTVEWVAALGSVTVSSPSR